jgi:hypothetical protein
MAVLASLATALVMRLPEDQLLSWGWRIPFLASIGRRPVFAAGLASALLFIYPFFPLIQAMSSWAVIVAIVIAAGVIHPMMFGSESSFFADLFPTCVRFTAISIQRPQITTPSIACH